MAGAAFEALGHAADVWGRLPAHAHAAAAHALWALATERSDQPASSQARDGLRARLDAMSAAYAALTVGEDAAGIGADLAASLAEWLWSDRTVSAPLEAFMAQGYFAHTVLAAPGAAPAPEVLDLAARASGEVQVALDLAQSRLADRFADAARSQDTVLAQSKTAMSNALGTLGTLTTQIRVVAINASIEARRIGPAGAGFGVIAEEVRRLSDTAQDTVDRLRTDSRRAG